MSDDVAEQLEISASALRIEENGINIIAENERRGLPRELFWPWFGANVSVLGLSYGSFVLGFGISFVQAAIVGLIGIVFSFWLCGVIATAGNRGSAPTMVLEPSGLWRTGESSALSDLLAALRGMGDGPHRYRRAGDVHGLYPHRLERGNRHQSRSHAGGRRPHHRRWRHGIRPHHAHAGRHHCGHGGLDGRLHRPHVEAHQLARRHPGAQRLVSIDHRCAGLCDDRLRTGLGQRGRRLLALPSP